MSRRREREQPQIEWEDNVPIPSFIARVRVPLYDEVLNTFLQSTARTRKIIVRNKNVKSVYQALVKRIKKRNLPIKIHLIKGELYLEKIQ